MRIEWVPIARCRSDFSPASLEPSHAPRLGDTVSRHLTIATNVLPRVRFAPARDEGQNVCELLRMQVNFTAR